MVIKQKGRHYEMELLGGEPTPEKKKTSYKLIYFLLPVLICIGIYSIWLYQEYSKKKALIETYLGPFEPLPPAEADSIDGIQQDLALYKGKLTEILTLGEEPENPNYAKQAYSSQDLSEQERYSLNNSFSCPPGMVEEDPYLVHLILQSKSLAEENEVQNWFNLYPVMTSSQIEKLYQILQRERVKLLNIDIKYSGKELYDKVPLLIKNRQYNLYKDIVSALGYKVSIVNANLLLGNFDEALKLAKEIQEDNSLSSPVRDFNFSLSLLLTSNYEKSYREYKKNLARAQKDEEYRELVKPAIEDLTHYIKYSDYKFDRSFANAILGLHYYYFEEELPEGEDYRNYMRCFLYSYDKKKKPLKQIAEKLNKLIEE